MDISDMSDEDQREHFKWQIPMDLHRIYAYILTKNRLDAERDLLQFRANLENANFAAACMSLRLSGELDAYAWIFEAFDE